MRGSRSDILNVVIRPRPVALAVVLALVATLLAGCRTNVGTAARVGDERISENRINDFVTPTGAQSSAVADAASRQSTLIPPKVLVVEFLVREAIFERAVRKSGGLPSVGTLNALRERGLAAVLQINGDGAQVERQLAQQLAGVGVKSALASHIVRWCELVYYLGAERFKAPSLQDAFSRALKLAGPVSISRRYGTWDPANLAVTGQNADTPPYLTIRPTAAASAP